MKAVAVLTEGRSGSNWLGSLTNSTGRMGISHEWLNPSVLPLETRSFDELYTAVVKKGSTNNGRFAIKLFPHHLRRIQSQFDVDFVRRCQEGMDIGFIFLHRRDRLRQAISFTRGMMTRQWRSTDKAKGDEAYDFSAICRNYFLIENSYSFWNSYLSIRGISSAHFAYEDLISNPQPYVDAVARLLDVESSTEYSTNLLPQRDEVTEDWIIRFRSDMEQHGVLSQLDDKPATRNFNNFIRFLRKQPMRGVHQYFR